MKRLVLLLTNCATLNPYAYDELASCPVPMSEEQHLSGVVRCRAMCSSYGRDFDAFARDCRCFCKPVAGAYRAPAVTEMLWSVP